MQITKTTIQKLHRLLQGETISSSQLGKQMVEELRKEELLSLVVHGRNRSYKATKTSALKNYLESTYEELRNFDNALEMTGKKDLTRADLASESGNSKLAKVRSCPGFPINIIAPLHCKINERDIILAPQPGTFTFLTEWQEFSIPKEAIVVGVENMENFRKVAAQKALFTGAFGETPLLFVSRYPQSADLRHWLMSIPNRYVHFGDFDLAGISIFLSEFQRYLGDRSSYLIPKDIEDRIKRGSTTRYNQQYEKFHHLQTQIAPLQALIDMINKYHRCYDQEGYIGMGPG